MLYERGNTMPKGSKELTDARKDEIVNACEKLYKTMSFKDITIKEIGAVTSFTRTSIYNYFETKEEIFLALLKREYEKLIESLNTLTEENVALSSEELASALARIFEERSLLLKLMTMNNYDMEACSRPENLAEFKESYGESLRALDRCFSKFTGYPKGEREELLYIFLPFVYGIYPYAEVTEKQRVAMTEAKVPFVYHSVYELTYNCVKNLLKGKGE